MLYSRLLFTMEKNRVCVSTYDSGNLISTLFNF